MYTLNNNNNSWPGRNDPPVAMTTHYNQILASKTPFSTQGTITS